MRFAPSDISVPDDRYGDIPLAVIALTVAAR